MIKIYYINKNNIPIYIGKSKNPNKCRKSIHKKRFGNDIELVEIDEVEKDEWKFWEKYWISQFKTWGFKLENGNNGGGGPNNQSEDSKRKISLKNKGRKNGPRSEEIKQKISQANKGYKHSEEIKKLISEKLRGKIKRTRTLEHRLNLSKSKKGKPKPKGFGEKLSLSKNKFKLINDKVN